MKSNKIFLTFIIIAAGLAAYIVFLSAKMNKLTRQANQFEKEQIAFRKQSDSLEKLIGFYSQKSVIDDLLIQLIVSERYDESDTIYKMLQTINEDQFKGFKDSIYSIDSLIKFKFSQRDNQLSSLQKTIKTAQLEIKDLSGKEKTLKQKENELRKQIKMHSDSLKFFQSRLSQLNESHKSEMHVLEFQKDGNTIYYTGEKENGMANGYGIGLWSTGGTYKGYWKNNLRNGEGTYKWKDGDTYEGEWVNGMKTGHGKYVWKDGQYYIGEWVNNKREGFGTVYYPNGTIQYEGEWSKDKFIQPHRVKSKK